MNDIEKSLERITNIVTTLADLLREIDEQRERDRKEFDRRISALEYHVYSKWFCIEQLATEQHRPPAVLFLCLKYILEEIKNTGG